jgi:hypothetical protein
MLSFMFDLYSYPFYIIGLLAQIFCIVHALKTGRKEWLYLLIFLPVAGAAVYFVMEIWPEVSRGEFRGNFIRVFLPNYKIKEMKQKLRVSDTITNKLNLANAYAEQKQYDKAIELAEDCLKDPYINHSGVWLQLARLFFGNEQYAETIAYLDKAKAMNYDKLDRPEDELIYARALAQTGDLVQAEEQFKKIIRVHHSMEAMYHYGMMLKKVGRNDEARQQFRAVREEKDLHPRYVRRLNSRWIRLSKSEMNAA